MQWKRKPQETPGKYFFSGSFFVTQGVLGLLTMEEIQQIYADVRNFVYQENGIDYLPVYEHPDG